MLAFQAGDSGAFGQLFEKYKAGIVTFCFRYCADREMAEELAQEVFLRVYKAAPRYRPQARFSTWIFRIAVNVCLNAMRKEKFRRRTHSLDAPKPGDTGATLLHEVPDERPLASSHLEDSEMNAAIHQAIGTLPEKQRAALLLRINEGFSYKEISTQMQCSENMVKTLIHRGRSRLKNLLAHYFKET